MSAGRGRAVDRATGRSSSASIGFSGFVAETLTLPRGRARAGASRRSPSASSPSAWRADVYPEARALVQAHQRKGHTLAIVSSATRYQVEAARPRLGIPHVLCTRLEVENGRFTGSVVKPDLLRRGQGIGGARRSRPSAASTSRESYFYTDSDEDLPLLEIVGRPRPTNPNARLAAIARASAAGRRGASPAAARRPRSRSCARRSRSAASSRRSLLGLPAGGARPATGGAAVNVAATTWGELGTALAGVDLRVHRRGAPVVAPPGGLHLQPPERRRRCCCSASSSAATSSRSPSRRCAEPDLRPALRRSPARSSSTASTTTCGRGARAGDRRAAERPLDRDRAGGHAQCRRRGSAASRRARSTSRWRPACRSCRSCFRNTLDALPKHGIILRPAHGRGGGAPADRDRRAGSHEDLDRHIEEVRAALLGHARRVIGQDATARK